MLKVNTAVRVEGQTYGEMLEDLREQWTKNVRKRDTSIMLLRMRFMSLLTKIHSLG